jgi:hypothetical protein
MTRSRAGVARRIEVVHGYVIVCESPTPQHQQVARRLANTFEAARPKEPCTRVQMEPRGTGMPLTAVR